MSETSHSKSFERLQYLTDICKRESVGWSLQYEDGEGRWYLSINSPAPSERAYFKKRGTPNAAIDEAIEWVESLTPPKIEGGMKAANPLARSP